MRDAFPLPVLCVTLAYVEGSDGRASSAALVRFLGLGLVSRKWYLATRTKVVQERINEARLAFLCQKYEALFSNDSLVDTGFTRLVWLTTLAPALVHALLARLALGPERYAAKIVVGPYEYEQMPLVMALVLPFTAQVVFGRIPVATEATKVALGVGCYGVTAWYLSDLPLGIVWRSVGFVLVIPFALLALFLCQWRRRRDQEEAATDEEEAATDGSTLYLGATYCFSGCVSAFGQDLRQSWRDHGVESFRFVAAGLLVAAVWQVWQGLQCRARQLAAQYPIPNGKDVARLLVRGQGRFRGIGGAFRLAVEMRA